MPDVNAIVAGNVKQVVAAAALALVASFATVAGAAASEPASTIVVFDGSGSMWGKISGDRDSKFAATREAVRKSLGKLAPQTRLGLAAFGHRRKADCSDVEIMLAPEPLDAARIMAPLEKFNPKGKGPVVAAVREAAAVLAKSTQGPASLIVIHDDLDNCSQDPCAAGEEIAKAFPKLAVHVISIGLARPELQKMACLPRLTGGRHFDAGDATSLGSAIDDVMTLVSAEAPAAATSPAAAAPAPVAEAAAPPAPTRPVGPPALKLKATLGSGGPAVIVPLSWRVRKASDVATAAPIATARAAEFSAELPPGSYVVDVAHGLVKATETFEVRATGPTVAAIVLQAGAVRVSAVLQKGMPALDQAVFTIAEPAAAASGGLLANPPRTLWSGGADAPPVILPVGNWRVTAELDRAYLERQVTVAAGALLDVVLPLGAGRVRLKASDRDGGPPLESLAFQISEDDADSASGRREVARSAAAEPEFTLPAGTYYLIARHGPSEVRERVLINAGDDLTRTLVFPLGQLGLQSRLAGSTAPLVDNVGYRIERLDGKQDMIRISKAAARVQLPPGRYRVESELGGQNVRVVREIDIRQGAQAALAFELQAATVQLKLGGPQRSVAGEIAWDVRDGQGRSVWQALQAEPRAFLAPGKYKIIVESRDKRGRAEVEIKSGETRVVEVALE